MYDGQRRYKRQILKVLYAGMHNKRIRTWNGGYRCPFCNQKVHDAYQSVLAHARGLAVGSFRQKYSRRVEHAVYAEYLEKLQDRVGR
jgi:hypothetical protein